MFKLLLLLGVAVSYGAAQTANYCSSTLCAVGKPHIACNSTGLVGAFAAKCAADKQIVDISSWKTHIVNKHNSFRNSIASGSVANFSAAVRMATMEWDNELESLATLNVKQCDMKHDPCRNTDRFKYSGQNLAWYWSDPANAPLVAIDTGIDSWYAEKQYATMTHINSYSSTSHTIGHFTPIVNDRNTRVGCALLSQTNSGGKEYFFACNYAQTNMLNKKTYQSGTVASQCTTGTNPSYTSLCSVNEAINPNLII